MFKNLLFATVFLFQLAFSQNSPGADETLDSVFATPSGMTDEEIKQANEFKHQGKRDATMKAECEKAKDSKNCGDASEAGAVLGKNFAGLEDQIGKVYGMLIGGMSLAGGKMPTVRVRDAPIDKKALNEAKDKKTFRKESKENSEEKDDYCIYAALGYEMVGGFWQQSLQSKIEKESASITDLQLRSLTALKETHLARNKTAKFQAYLYGATSACYITRAAASQGKVIMDPQYYIKMAGAGALSALYGIKASKHKKAAEAVQTVINKLDKLPSCNPWTETMCFCSEPSSKTMYADMYQNICILNGGNPETPKLAMGCGELKDGKMVYDETCKCKKTNSCFRARINAPNVKFGFGGNYMADANKAFDDLGSGNFDQGKFDSSTMQFGVNAAKLKGKIATTSPLKNPKLNKNEQAMADSLKGLVPAAVAGIAAQSNSALPSGFGNDGIGNAIAKVPKDLKSKIEASEDAKYGGAGGGFGSEVAEQSVGFAVPDGPSGPGTEVMQFAEKALENAGVTRTQDKHLFEIIGDRYRKSATHLNQ